MPDSGNDVWGIVLGGGSGGRFGGAKQFLALDGVSLLERSLTATRTACHGVVCVVPDPAAARLDGVRPGGWTVVAGGATRAGSVRAGLAAVPDHAEIIVVADAAHPLASPALFAAVVAAVRAGADGAFPGLPLTEAIATLAPDGTRTGSVPREGHVLVQMPQAFRAESLRAVHARGAEGVEDSAMVAALTVRGRPGRVIAVPGEARNVHVTTPEELDLARALAASSPDPLPRPPAP
jgi:2-C-methyl-D-erythritol 4-phosphate cytidylyltransferase